LAIVGARTKVGGEAEKAADQMKKKHRDRRIKYKNAPEALFIQL
jgi:hypothetical protein